MASPAASSYRRTSLRSLSTVIVLMVPLLTMTKIIPLARAANDAKYSSEVKLLDYFRDFDVHVPPVDSASDLKNLLINITIKPNEIFGLTVDEHQDLWIDLLLCLYWNSSAFTWLPSDFGNITYISWKKNHIWTPQFTSGTHLFLGADDMKPSRGKMLVMIRWDGLTEWCPQVRLVLSCKEQANGFDSFPADQLKCVSDISSIDTIHSGQYANIHNFTYSKHDFRRMGDLFGNSGYRLQYMRTETTNHPPDHTDGVALHSQLVAGCSSS
ncbi:neuronal acetylcholine receptor subunit beta-2-like isoform X2 [Varroa destructor]|uniref:Neurotransmitter-gated ion-channel ligand-binding domain-containing protein n=1 Tax=Varroa destructor TaxID=109461 RepID=A0A7M7KX26_VARDE|nr:neuronal acetylcholine receptor subunit beta-2-like isoform X2 [Varroa destructor]